MIRDLQKHQDKPAQLVLAGLCHFLKVLLRHPDPEDRIFNRFISDISIVLRETTLTISGSIETVSPVESERVRVVSLSSTEITEITRFQKTDVQGMDTLPNMLTVIVLA